MRPFHLFDGALPFELWLNDTALTQAEYLGSASKSYSFYSLATDRVGQVEQKPPAAEATIIIGAGEAVWDGEAGDKLWSNPENWSRNTLPD